MQNKRVWQILGPISLFAIGLTTLIGYYPDGWIPYSNTYSLVVVVPGFLLAFLFARLLDLPVDLMLPWGFGVAALISPLLFIFIARHILRSGSILPRASIIGFAVLIALSVAFALYGWHATPDWHSYRARRVWLLLASLGPALVLLVSWLAVRKRLTVDRSLALHWLVVAWLAWGAFPLWGELP